MKRRKKSAVHRDLRSPKYRMRVEIDRKKKYSRRQKHKGLTSL